MSASSGKVYKTGSSDVTGVGPVTWRVEETYQASGKLHIRVLLEARHVSERKPVTDDGDMQLIAAAIGAIW